MEKFPEHLHPGNKDKFSDILYKRMLARTRKKLYEHILHNDENSYFPMTTAMEMRVCKEIIPELEALGWKCKTSYADTALFIYSTDDPPPSCW